MYILDDKMPPLTTPKVPRTKSSSNGPVEYQNSSDLYFYPLCVKPLPGSFFITLTLKPKYYKFTAREQLRKSTKMLMEILGQLYESAGSCVAEFTEQANIHYHLTLYSSVVDRMRLIDAWRTIGHVHVKKQAITSEESKLRTAGYMTKQENMREELLSGELTAFNFENVRVRPVKKVVQFEYGKDLDSGDLIMSSIPITNWDGQ